MPTAEMQIALQNRLRVKKSEGRIATADKTGV